MAKEKETEGGKKEPLFVCDPFAPLRQTGKEAPAIPPRYIMYTVCVCVCLRGQKGIHLDAQSPVRRRHPSSSDVFQLHLSRLPCFLPIYTFAYLLAATLSPDTVLVLFDDKVMDI